MKSDCTPVQITASDSCNAGYNHGESALGQRCETRTGSAPESERSCDECVKQPRR